MADIILSVVIPIYNVEIYLRECINSVLNQNIQGYEVILVDDGSTDKSGIICDEYASRDSRIKVIHKTNGGLSSARNVGIKEAVGKYLTFVDSDDKIEVNTYYNNIIYLENHPEIDMLQYPTIWEYGSENERKDKMQEKQILGEKNIYINWWGGNILNHTVWNKIFRRHIFNHIVFPEGHSFEDLYIMPDLVKNIRGVFISSTGSYIYRKRAGSITFGKYSISKNLDHFEAQFKNYKMLCTYPDLRLFKVTAFLRVYRKLLTTKINYKDFQPTRQLSNLCKYIPNFVDVIKSEVSVKEKILVLLMKIFGLKKYMSLFAFYMNIKKIITFFRSKRTVHEIVL